MALTKIDDRGLKTPIDLLDNEKIRFGTGNDLEISHNGTHSFLENNTNGLYLRSDEILLQTDTGNEGYIVALLNGAVDIHYDGSKKFETTSWGVAITGTATVDQLDMFDNEKIRLGTGADLQIYHNGSYNYITGDSTGKNLYLRANVNDEGICVENNGPTYLAYDGSYKIQTTTNGLNIGGDSNVTGSWSQTDWNLEVYDNTADCYMLLAGRSGAAIELKDTDTAEAFVIAANGDCNLYSYKAGDNIRLHTTPSGGSVTERMRIDSSGTVLIGAATSHAGKFVVKDTDNSGNQIWVIGRANDNTGSISFRNNGDAAYTGRIQCGDTNGMEFNSAGSTRASLDTSGNFIINDGNLKILTAGHGIDFSAQTASSATGATANGELLDHFEEGTWTPVQPTVGWYSGAEIEGKYQRVGHWVTATFVVKFPDNGSGVQALIDGLPFVSGGSGSATKHGGSVTYTSDSNVYSFIVGNGQDRIYTYNSSGVGVQLSPLDNDDVMGTVIYRVS